MNAKEYFYEFGRAMYHIDGIYDEFAKNSEVSSTILWTLYALNDGKPHTQIEMCGSWSLPRSTVNSAVLELKEKGYVELQQIKGKRREMEILLTDDGKQYANRVLKKIYQKEQEVFSKLNKKDMELVHTLWKITKLFQEEKND